MANGFLRFSRNLLTLLRITVAITATLTLLAIPYRLVRDARPQANPTYHLTEIALPGYTNNDAMATNDRGEVIGRAWNGSSCGANYQPFLWRNGTARPLPLPEHFVSGIPFGLNDQGEVVGAAIRDDESVWGIAWKDGGRSIQLLRFKEGSAFFRGINRDGATVGMLIPEKTPSEFRAFQIKDKDFTVLGPFLAYRVNAGGAVVGAKVTGNSVQGVLWQNGEAKVLPLPSCFSGSRALALNNNGTAAGVAFGGSDEIRPVVWKSGRAAILEDVDGGISAINDRGQAAGAVTDEKWGYAAALWDGGKHVSLNEQISPNPNRHLYMALDINNTSQIVGVAYNRTEKAFRGFLLTPDK